MHTHQSLHKCAPMLHAFEMMHILCHRTWQRKQSMAFTNWINTVLTARYKHTRDQQATSGADSRAVLRCRLQLGQLRSQDESVLHAISQVGPKPWLSQVDM
jgi:hypothetical protein